PERAEASLQRSGVRQYFLQSRFHAGVTTFGQKAPRHSALPAIGICKQINQLGAAELRQIHSGRPWRKPHVRFSFGINNAPDSAMFPVDPLGVRVGVLIARIFVVPIHDPERAIRTGLSADRSKPTVVRDQKVFVAGAYEARSRRSELVVIDGALVNVADKNRSKPFRGILAALINIDAGKCRAEMLMVH